MAISGDLRVVLVELLSRLDTLNFLEDLPADQQKLYSFETLQIFVPIASRLGLSEIRRNLEDISFSYLSPSERRPSGGGAIATSPGWTCSALKS